MRTFGTPFLHWRVWPWRRSSLAKSLLGSDARANVRVLVTGGRDYADRQRVFDVLGYYHSQQPFSVLIHGCADGADTLAQFWAASVPLPVERYPAAWDDLTTPPVVLRYRRDGTPYNAAAGGIRNGRMLREGKPDVCVAFSGGRGTGDMCQRCHAARPQVPVLVVPG